MTIKELESRIAIAGDPDGRGYCDSDGERCGLTSARRVASAIMALLKQEFPAGAGYTVQAGKNNHFTTSGFVQKGNNGKIAYYSFSDYRYFGNSVLWRSAEHLKDYTGGRNNNGKCADLVQGIRKLIG